VVIRPGRDGTLEELAETAQDGILAVQIGFPTPDAVSTAFGGELRMGYRIRGGKLAEAVRGGTVGGLVISTPGAPSLLGSVAGVGSHGELVDTLSAPPLLVRPFSVAGS
jgi:predicted Zn-dependent protease